VTTRLEDLSNSFNIDPLKRRSDRQAALTIYESEPLSDATRAAPATQSILAVAHYFYAGEVLTNILFDVTTAGAGTAPTLIKAAVWDSGATPTCKAVSANLATDAMWTAIGIAPVPVAYTFPSEGLYYLAFLKNGAFATTDVQVACVNVNAGMAGAVGSSKRRIARLGTSKTDMAVNDTGSYTGVAQIPWNGWN
jgi:hypothetical protein